MPPIHRDAVFRRKARGPAQPRCGQLPYAWQNGRFVRVATLHGGAAIGCILLCRFMQDLPHKRIVLKHATRLCSWPVMHGELLCPLAGKKVDHDWRGAADIADLVETVLADDGQCLAGFVLAVAKGEKGLAGVAQAPLSLDALHAQGLALKRSSP